MSEKYEEIMQQLSELTTATKEGGDTADIDRLSGELGAISDQLVELQKAMDKPDRKGAASEWFDKEAADDSVIAKGKFQGMKASEVLFVKQFLDQARTVHPGGVKAPSAELMKVAGSAEVQKLLTATGSLTGDELVPQGLASELWQDSFLQSRVVGNLMTVPMPTDPFVIPLSWGAITWRKGTEGEATDAQNPATADSTLTATEQVAEINWSYNLDEDAVIAVLPTLRQELSRSAAEGMDAFVINADATATSTGNINMDDATPATDSYYLSGGQDGIRHFYLVDVTGQSANISTTLTDALWRAGVSRMGKYGVDPNQVLAITNPKTYLISLMSLTNVRTVDKYGTMATILSGELAKMDGIPIIVSSSVALAEDDGKVCATAASNDEGQIALVHRPSWKVGFRRQMMMEVARDIKKRQYIMVVSFRIAVASRDRTGTHTAGIHGITYA